MNSLKLLKKRSYLLLEILIALGLLVTIMVPMMRTHFSISAADYTYSRNVESERLSSIALAEVKKNILNGSIPWSFVEDENHSSEQWQLLDLEEKQVLYRIERLERQKGKISNGYRYYKLKISLQIDGNDYQYIVVAGKPGEDADA